jgi:16S rRNA (cytidine1402-2'-O)-methyltransferase
VTSRAGTLSVVGTPIGNLNDLTLRAASTLLRADAVICEDTRRTGKLLAHIRNLAANRLLPDLDETDPAPPAAGPMSATDPARPSTSTDRGVRSRSASRGDLIVANEHTEFSRIPEILERLGRGQALALVTDAGMPIVSDPGAAIVRAVAEAGHRIEVVPGPSAVSAALALAGMPADRFVFEGFLPRKGTARRRRLTDLAGETRTIVLYEAPHRVVKTLRDLAGVCGGERRVVVTRELTKLHEEADRTTLAEAAGRFGADPPRGEFVIVVAGADVADEPPSEQRLIAMIDAELAAGASARDAVAAVVAGTGQPKRLIYALANSRVDARRAATEH